MYKYIYSVFSSYSCFEGSAKCKIRPFFGSWFLLGISFWFQRNSKFWKRNMIILKDSYQFGERTFFHGFVWYVFIKFRLLAVWFVIRIEFFFSVHRTKLEVKFKVNDLNNLNSLNDKTNNFSRLPAETKKKLSNYFQKQVLQWECLSQIAAICV